MLESFVFTKILHLSIAKYSSWFHYSKFMAFHWNVCCCHYPLTSFLLLAFSCIFPCCKRFCYHYCSSNSKFLTFYWNILPACKCNVSVQLLFLHFLFLELKGIAIATISVGPRLKTTADICQFRVEIMP